MGPNTLDKNLVSFQWSISASRNQSVKNLGGGGGLLMYTMVCEYTNTGKNANACGSAPNIRSIISLIISHSVTRVSEIAVLKRRPYPPGGQIHTDEAHGQYRFHGEDDDTRQTILTTLGFNFYFTMGTKFRSSNKSKSRIRPRLLN